MADWAAMRRSLEAFDQSQEVGGSRRRQQQELKMLFFVFSPALSPRSTLPGPEHDGTAAWTCLAVITCFGARTVTISLLQFAHSLTPPAGHFRFSCFQHPPASPSHSLLKKKYISEFHSFTLHSTFGLKNEQTDEFQPLPSRPPFHTCC